VSHHLGCHVSVDRIKIDFWGQNLSLSLRKKFLEQFIFTLILAVKSNLIE